MSKQANDILKQLPSVARLLEREEVEDWLHGLPRAVVVDALRAALEEARAGILNGGGRDLATDEVLLARAEEIVFARTMPAIRRVINATGIVLHTGLGRAPLCDAAIEAIVEGAAGYCNLELDLETGKRGSRTAHVAESLARACGAEAATVVNNNAAATLLILNTFADNREVIVSRGQLIEIGGSFRLPDIMRASGATLREVGTTNRTRVADYQGAINSQTSMLLHVHTSNYRVVGFAECPGIREIANVAHQHGLLAVDDLGSGALIDLSMYGLPREPVARESIEAGADLVCFSGDKLLGGPQCGVIAGRRELIEQLQAGPLMRTYRLGKLELLALEATLREYLDSENAVSAIRTLNMLTASQEDLARRADELQGLLSKAAPGEHFYVGSDVGFAGGGSLPTEELSTVVVQWRPSECSAESVAGVLRTAEVPVVVRIRDDAIYFDVRTILNDDLEDLVNSVSLALMDLYSDRETGDGLSLPIVT